MVPERRGAWRLESRQGLAILSCDLLSGIDGVGHAFSTRRSSDVDFDLGPAEGASEVERERRRRLCGCAGLGDREPVVPIQVHGANVAEIVAAGPDRASSPRADAVLALRSADRYAVLSVRTADCVSVLLADREGRALGAVHAGWRGIAAGVVPRAVERLGALGIPPRDLGAACGPAIGPCCYEVGPEVVAAIAAATGANVAALGARTSSGRLAVDLSRAVASQLHRAGLAEDRISAAPWCTSCSGDLFFSYRRQGPAAGRMMAVVGWAEAVP